MAKPTPPPLGASDEQRTCLTVYLPRAVKRALKIVAARKDLNVSAYVLGLIERDLISPAS